MKLPPWDRERRSVKNVEKSPRTISSSFSCGKGHPGASDFQPLPELWWRLADNRYSPYISDNVNASSPPALPFLKLRAWRWQEHPDAVDAQPIAWILRMSRDGYLKKWKSILGLSSGRPSSSGSIWFFVVHFLTIFLWILSCLSPFRKFPFSVTIL